MTTNVMDDIWAKFFRERSHSLFGRFPGYYRSIVVDTNDPLQIRRIRFKCPELHDFNLNDNDCPWALMLSAMGGNGSGSWHNAVIGDIIWVTWEKDHPYGPIWVGAADPTRRKTYPLESIYTKSPLSLKEDGSADDRPDDFLEEYLPKDFRPMSFGAKDRYGSFENNSSVGFFPKEHESKSTAPGIDAVSDDNFKPGDAPEVNNPDQKYMVRCTKGGHFGILSDVGYFWKKEEDTEIGEFLGDVEEDREFEIERYKFLTRLFNEDRPTDTDQRRLEYRTRAGHKFEMRDVGYAQKDGGISGNEKIQDAKTREGEYGEPRTISKHEDSDERWVKLRSKGGHVVQLMDAGFHPEEDDFYKRTLLEDNDNETEDWGDRDSRQIRMVTRYGIKMALDDRGSDPRKADSEPDPKGNGFLLKTRRGFAVSGELSSTPRGYGFEAIDKDDLDTTRWYSPKSKIIEINDKNDYVLACTDMASEISREFEGLRENEFATKIAMTQNPEFDTNHLKLDKQNGYIRLKTSGGADNDRRPNPDIGLQDADVGLNQGLEARDGRVGGDGAWVEVVDQENRGIWFSRKIGLSIFRAKPDADSYFSINDESKLVLIRNNQQDGVLQIFCNGRIEIIAADEMAFRAKSMSFLSEGNIVFGSNRGSTQLVLGSNFVGTNRLFQAPTVHGNLPGAEAGDGATNNQGSVAGNLLRPDPRTEEKIIPTDRAATDSGQDFSEVEEKVITGQDDPGVAE